MIRRRRTNRGSLIAVALALAAPFLPNNAQCAPGYLYETDLGSGTIFRFAPNGAKGVFASGFVTPVGLAFDGKGNVFISAPGSGTVSKIAPDGTQSAFATIPDGPTGLAFDGSGNLFVGVFNTGVVLKFTSNGTQSTFASGLMNATGLAFDRDGNLFAADLGGAAIYKITATGNKSILASGLPGAAGLAFDKSGNLFATSNSVGAIYKFTPNGTKSTFASGINGAAGLAFDTAGNLFVASNTSGMIFKFTPAGMKSTFASGLDQATFLAFEPLPQKLLNASGRAFVQTGDNVLIVGFIVGGNTLLNNPIVVRAIGPSLSQAGVANPLFDPKLELHDASGAIIAENDNWQDTQRSQIIASGLAPANARESAILTYLPAGGYTAIVRGANGTIGTALVEVFNLP